MSEWQPIESAPNQKPVLIFYKNPLGRGRIIKAFKCGKFENEDTSCGESDHAEYCEEKDAWFDPPGWYELIDNWDEFSHVFVSNGEPTHWQPLPPPPSNGV